MPKKERDKSVDLDKKIKKISVLLKPRPQFEVNSRAMTRDSGK
jgi:hypothetical protein